MMHSSCLTVSVSPGNKKTEGEEEALAATDDITMSALDGREPKSVPRKGLLYRVFRNPSGVPFRTRSLRFRVLSGTFFWHLIILRRISGSLRSISASQRHNTDN